MKFASENRQKWILSLALIAVLGSQYYYQAPSNQVQSYSLSSKADEVAAAQEKVDAATLQVEALKKDVALFPKLDKKALTKDIVAIQKEKEEALVKATQHKEVVEKKLAELKKETPKEEKPAPAADKAKEKPDVEKALTALTKKVESLEQKIEGKAAAEPCADCEKSLIKKPLKPLVVGDEDKVETAKERRERLAEARKEKRLAKEEARREKEAAKREKLQEEREEANDNFKERMEEIEADCTDIGIGAECVSGRMMLELKSFVGTKPDKTVVAAAFSKYLSPTFQSAISDMTDPVRRQEAINNLQSLMADMPLEYRALKEQVLNTLSSSVQSKASEINRNYFVKSAQLKTSNPMESIDLYMKGNQQASLLNQASQTVVDVTRDTTASTDAATFNYMRDVYIKNVNDSLNLLLKASGGTTVNIDDVNGTNGSRGTVRGGTNLNVPSNRNITNGINFGTPSNSRQGTRGS